MKIEQIAEDFSITSQIHAEQMDKIASSGFRSIICCRPDGEEAGQPSFAVVQAAATAAGIKIHHVPIVPNAVGPSDVAAFAKALNLSSKPVLGFCRTGKRAAALYSAVTEVKA